jgi:hypothetical protein
MHLRILITLGIILLLSGCSTTPGDAANRSGHPEQAADLYREGVGQGDALAAFKLGMLIEEKRVSADVYGGSGDWFIKGCSLGNLPSCHNAGVGYEYGKSGLSKDLDNARTYYLKAAKRGYMQSQYNVGSLYANEYFNDDIEGLRWLILANEAALLCRTEALCKWILDDPPGHMKNLRSRMTEVQIYEAEKLAKSWAVEK